MNALLFLMLGIFVFTAVVDGRRKNEEANDEEIPDEARLYQYLMHRYDRLNPDRVIIPVRNISETQLVNFGLTLTAFLDFDPDSGIGVLVTWESHSWKDAFLMWNPADFGGIEHIRIPIRKIWKPDIVLYNAVDTKTADVLCAVIHDGKVSCFPRVNQKIVCQQPDSGKVRCVLKYASWMYDGFRLDLDFYSKEMDVSNYTPTNDYTLLAHSGKKNVKVYPCCAEPFPDLTFTLEFEKTAEAEWWEGKK